MRNDTRAGRRKWRTRFTRSVDGAVVVTAVPENSWSLNTGRAAKDVSVPLDRKMVFCTGWEGNGKGWKRWKFWRKWNSLRQWWPGKMMYR